MCLHRLTVCWIHTQTTTIVHSKCCATNLLKANQRKLWKTRIVNVQLQFLSVMVFYTWVMP